MEDAGLSKAQTKKRIRDLAHGLPSVARQVGASPPFTGEPIVARIINLIDQRSQVTIQRLLENSDEAEK
jgi:serine/threonine-protein kinase HipA